MIPLPGISANPSDLEYFWFQLPWAVPGFITFVVGMSLAGASLVALRRTDNRPLLIAFILFCVGFGSLGLLLGLRAVIKDLDLLLLLNRAGYFAVVWLAPGGYFFNYILTNRRYPSLLVWGGISVATVGFAYFGLLTGRDFSGEWFHYPFGHYPTAALPLKLWGAIAAAGYLLGAVPMTIHHYRRHYEDLLDKKYLFISQHLCLLLVISNLPSLSGIPIFPMSSFAFIPLLVMGYGIFRADFLSVNELLFQRQGLFKFLAGLLTFGFLGISILAALTLQPVDHAAAYARPVFLLPMFSGVCAFALAIFLAGSNPDQKLNMLAAASLMLAGTFMIVMTVFKLDLSLIVTRRIEQILYTIFLFTPGVHLRFAMLALGKKTPRAARIADLISAALCIALWTPYFFSGFYEHWFGRISVGGPGLNVYGAMAFVVAAFFIATWWRARNETPSGLGSLVVLALVLGDVLIFLNLPATMGIPLYPLSELQFIPASLLAFAVIKYGAIPVTGEATAIGNRVSLLILLFVPASMTFYLISLAGAGVWPAFFHTLLVAAPLALAFYMISFIFLRPTAVKMDQTVRQLALEKERTDAALVKTEEARRESEALSRFAHLVNSHSDLKEIFKEISKYLYETFGIAGAWLFLPDEKEEFLVSFRAYSYRRVSDEIYNFVKNLRIPLNEEGGFTYLVWKRKKPFYLPHIPKFEFEFDRHLIETIRAASFLNVPLVVNDKSIGMMILSNTDIPLDLGKRDIRMIDTVCAQVAGVINTVHLLRQTEKQRADTAALNRLVKSLNENSNLQVIMEKVHAYMRENFGIQYYSLLTADAEKKHLRLTSALLPESLSAQDREQVFNFTVPLKGAKGGHGLVMRRKRPTYFPDFSAGDLDWLTHDEIYVAEVCKIKSYLFLPLLLNQEPVGILNFSNSTEPMQLTEDDLARLSILGEQLAGIIHGSALFDQVETARNTAELERRKSEKLLLNILPADVAQELKEKGATEPVLYENVSVMFTDFHGFTRIAETMSPQALIQDLDACFVQFDKITERFNLEKLKTIGDSYMCAGGIPRRNKTHAVDCVLAALEIQAFMNLMKQIKADQGLPYWELRLGIHTGPLVAGVIGEKKFAYDVWGDTVNTASRMESSGATGRINISYTTYEHVKEFFDCEYRGQVNAKNKGEIGMYFVNGLRPQYALPTDSNAPNGMFWQAHAALE
jgi:class 3 adenylate cyclase